MEVIDFFTQKKIKLDGKKINIYLCGPTVYDSPHIGNMRPIIVFDILNRLLKFRGKDVFFIHNITDVDDKIINKSIQSNISESEIAKKYEIEYLNLLDKLNILKPTLMPKVTENIEEIKNFIQDLISKKYAYEINGSIYFDTAKFSNYAKDSNIKFENLINKNDDINKFKKDPKDFVLWKMTDQGINWNSKWGKGRPGWHTECSCFVKENLDKKNLDIHGGGIDLRFPHHINEMAQYEALTKNKISKSWLYVGHVFLKEEKMSKSIGNVFYAKDFIKKYNPIILRMLMLLTDYQKPINLDENVINNAQNFLKKILNALKKALISISLESESEINPKNPSNEFLNSLENNLNFSKALTILMQQVNELNKTNEIVRKEKLVEEIVASLFLLGFNFELNYNEIKDKIKSAKLKKNYQKLDLLRELIIK